MAKLSVTKSIRLIVFAVVDALAKRIGLSFEFFFCFVGVATLPEYIFGRMIHAATVITEIDLI